MANLIQISPSWLTPQAFLCGNVLLMEARSGSGEYIVASPAGLVPAYEPRNTIAGQNSSPLFPLSTSQFAPVPTELLIANAYPRDAYLQPSASEFTNLPRTCRAPLLFACEGGQDPSAQANASEEPEPVAFIAGEPDQFGGDDELDTELTIHEGNYRKFYALYFKELSLKERIDRAMHAYGDALLALCLDPDPAVIIRVMDNPNSNIPCARLVAMHTTESASLEAIARKSTFLFDLGVRRHIMRNPIAPEALLRRIFSGVSMHYLFLTRFSGDVAEKAKLLSAIVLREKFRRASGGECAALIFKTEGRCLRYLIGEHLSKETIDALCSRERYPEPLIENLVNFQGLPPEIIRHLMSQVLVKRNARWRGILLAKPSCPPDVKIKFK